MSKVLIINFEDSEEYLYQWLINHKNYESVIKRLIDEEINIGETVKEENSDDDMFDADFFRINEKKKDMASIDDILKFFN